MRFLFRLVFWLGVVVFFLPSDKAQNAAASRASAKPASSPEAAVLDIHQFCARRPETCATATDAAAEIGQKAQAGAKALYGLLRDASTPNETGSVVKKGRNVQVASGSQNTLTPVDLLPGWRGGEQQKDSGKKPF